MEHTNPAGGLAAYYRSVVIGGEGAFVMTAESFAPKSNFLRILTERGYILRRVGGYGFPNALRMTIGSDEANEGVVAALTEFLGR